MDQYRIGTSFRNWLIGITQNTALEELRRSKRYTGRLSRYANLVEKRLQADQPDDDDARTKALQDCLSRLDAPSVEMIRALYR